MVRQLRMGRLSVFFLFSFFVFPFSFFLQSQAQEVQVSLSSSLGLGYQLDEQSIYEPGFSGAGIRFDRAQSFGSSRMSLVNGIEYSFQGWGSQLLVNNGFSYRMVTWKRFSASTQVQFLNGMVLTKPKAPYVGAIEAIAQAKYRIGSRMAIMLNIGFRYTASPGYRKYGPIWSYSDIPIGIGIAFKP